MQPQSTTQTEEQKQETIPPTEEKSEKPNTDAPVEDMA